MSDHLARAIEAHAEATREQTEMLRQIAGLLFEIAQGSEESGETPEVERYIDGTPRE